MASYELSDRYQTLMHQAQEHLEKIDPSGGIIDEEYSTIVDALYVLYLKHKPYLSNIENGSFKAYCLENIAPSFIKSIEDEANKSYFMSAFKFGILHNIGFFMASSIQALLDGPYMDIAKNLYLNHFYKKREEAFKSYRYPTEEERDPFEPYREPWIVQDYKGIRVRMLILKAFVVKCMDECGLKIDDVNEVNLNYTVLYESVFNGRLIDEKRLLLRDEKLKTLFSNLNNKIGEALLILKLSQQDNNGKSDRYLCSDIHFELST